MSKIRTTLTFLAGAAIGGSTVWYFIKDSYIRRAEEEISSVREAYARREQQQKNAEKADIQDDTPVGPTSVSNNKMQDKGSITEFTRRVQGEERYTNYSKTVVPEKTHAGIELEKMEKPYVISPDDFNELEGYTPISLTYFADGVLADEYGVIIDDIEDIIGDGLEHFGEYEEDSVFVRSDLKRCDYEILRNLDTYEKFRKTLPSNI